MPFGATIESSDSPAAMMKKLRRAATEAMRTVGETWREEMLPEHFTEEAASHYGYAKRYGEDEPPFVPSARGIVLKGGVTKYGEQRMKKNPKYYWDKQRRGFGKTPLVYSGESERAAEESAKTLIKKDEATITAEVRMNMPLYFFKRATRNDGTMSPDKVAELTTITFDEQQYLQQVVQRTVEQMLRSAPVRQRRAA